MAKDKIDTEAMKELALYVAREICENVITDECADDGTIMEVHTTMACVSFQFVCDAFNFSPDEYAGALDMIDGITSSPKHKRQMIAAYREVQRIGDERLH